MDFGVVTIGGSDIDFSYAAADNTVLVDGSYTPNPAAQLATGADASYTNQFVNNSQTADGAAALANGETVPNTSITLPPMLGDTTSAVAMGGGPVAPPVTPVVAPVVALAEFKPPQPKPLVVTVKKGDSLSAIAARYDLSWQDLYKVAANKKVVGGDPNLIHPGQELKIPGEFVEPTEAEIAAARAAFDAAAAETAAASPAASPAAAITAEATPVVNGGGTGIYMPGADVNLLQTQLFDINKKLADGQRLAQEFRTQLSYAQSDESKATITQSLQQQLDDNQSLEEIRSYLLLQLAPYEV